MVASRLSGRTAIRLLLAALVAGVILSAAAWWLLGGRTGDALTTSQWDRLAGLAATGDAPATSEGTDAAPGRPPGEAAAGDSGADTTAGEDPAGDGQQERRPSPSPTASPEPPAGTAADAGPRRFAADVGLRPRRPEPDPELLAAQWRDYVAQRPKTILELQPFRQAASAGARGPGGVSGTARLVNLNPGINQWYLLELTWPDTTETYHLANALPRSQDLRVDGSFPDGVVIATARGETRCPLWSDGALPSLREAARTADLYTLLCDDRIVLRQAATGRKTRMETITDFLRDRLPGGERITVFVRETFYQDAYRMTAEVDRDADGLADAADTGPSRAPLDATLQGAGIEPVGLGLPLRNGPVRRLKLGSWYGVAGEGGVFVSAIRPDAVDPALAGDYGARMGPLDEVEASALAYLVAFDLDRFELAFAMGTDHPRLGWSERVPEEARIEGMPGPDGIDSARPLVRTGIVPPYQLPRVAAAFTAGFKRSHGAFRYGDLAQRNLGSHYGMLESGTVFSRLQPGLSTLWVLEDGRVELGTWTDEHRRLLPRLAHARQNGVPIIDHGPDAGGPGIPGAELMRFGAGNWSGSQDGRYRTLRAGACLLREQDGRRYLAYGYFTSATPAAMARVFQAYGCSYAMLLDMNALEHTYLAVYRLHQGRLVVSHLIDEMRVLDREQDGVTLPRFLAFADNREFFYLLRKPPSAAAASGSATMDPPANASLGPSTAGSAGRAISRSAGPPSTGPDGAVTNPPSTPASATSAAASPTPGARPQDGNAALLEEIARVHALDPGAAAALRSVFAGSAYIGQGNPAVTRHPATPEECREKLQEAGVEYRNARFERICGAPYMAPLYDPETQEPEDATSCIDMFEFPNIPCAYPVVWVRASEAARICSAMGKRLCDAHEWEGACAGRLLEPGYPFELAEGVAPATGFERMRAAHNRTWASRKTWAYGPEYRSDLCAMSSSKSPGCDGGGWRSCGSNTFPVGMFPECRSPLRVYDQHGNAAEHMNLPLDESQMASRGSAELGHTEMKGSWFIWASYRAHEDACRWRAPYWHGSRVMSPDSHHNYHLGFRCCSTVGDSAE